VLVTTGQCQWKFLSLNLYWIYYSKANILNVWELQLICQFFYTSLNMIVNPLKDHKLTGDLYKRGQLPRSA